MALSASRTNYQMGHYGGWIAHSSTPEWGITAIRTCCRGFACRVRRPPLGGFRPQACGAGGAGFGRPARLRGYARSAIRSSVSCIRMS
jgi:hypothetical protein